MQASELGRALRYKSAMPSARIATIVFVCASVLATTACEDQSAAPKAPKSGAELYASVGCSTCHGPDLKGGKLAPPITPIHPEWTRAALIEYLADPQTYAAKSPRLSEMKKKYMMPMQPYAMLSAADRGSLADYVLGGGR